MDESGLVGLMPNPWRRKLATCLKQQADASRCKQAVSEGFENLTGYTREEAVGLRLSRGQTLWNYVKLLDIRNRWWILCFFSLTSGTWPGKILLHRIQLQRDSLTFGPKGWFVARSSEGWAVGGSWTIKAICARNPKGFFLLQWLIPLTVWAPQKLLQPRPPLCKVLTAASSQMVVNCKPRLLKHCGMLLTAGRSLPTEHRSNQSHDRSCLSQPMLCQLSELRPYVSLLVNKRKTGTGYALL